VDLPIAGYHIYQDRSAQGVSQAAVALQEAALQLFPETLLRVLELGSGCGIVCIMLALRRPAWKISGIEIQPHLAKLARGNASLCALDIFFRQDDIRTFEAKEKFGLILSNPPWLKAGSGIPSKDPAREISRRELLCTLEDIAECVQRNLSPEGSALLLYPSVRLPELNTAVEKSLLDIIDTLPAAGLKEHMICHIRHKGQ